MTSAAGVHSVLLRPASLIGLLACLVGVASAEKNVVFIGDMQCQYMNVPGCASCNETTGMYGQLRDRTRSAMLTLDPAAGPVSWTFNCIGGRRIGSCDLDCGVAGPFWSQYHSESTWASHCAAETSCCGRADCKPTAEREVAEYCTSVQANQTVDTTVLVVQSGLADLNSIHWRGGGAHPELIRSLERLRNAVSAHCHPMTALVIVETFPLQETPGSWTAGGTDAASCTSEWLCADGRSFWLAEAMRTQAATTASPLFRPTFFFDTSHLVVAPAAHGMYYTDDISIRQVSEALAARLAHLLQFEITSHSCALNTDVVPGMVLNQCPTIVTSGDICTAGCAAGYFWVTDAGLPQIGCSGSVLNWNFYCKANAPTPAPVPPALAPADLTVNALVIGDSQCRRMSPPYAALNLFDLVTSLTASTIRKYMESTVTEVEFTWDCDMNLRRFDQCSMNCADAEPRWQALSAVEKGATGSSDWANQCQDMQAQCSTGTQAIRSSCLDAPPDIVVVMLGTAELDALVWRDASRSSRMAHIEQMLDSVKLWCQGVSSVVLVSPLPIQTEAGSVNAADNTCNVRWGCDDDRQATLEQEMQDIARTYSALRVQFLNSTASTTVSQYDTVDRVHYSGSTAVIETSAAVGRVVGQLACVSQTAPAIGADSAELYCGINLATCAHPEEGQLTILTDPNAVWSTTEANAQCTEMLNSANFGQGMDPVANRLTCEDRDRTAADTLWGVAIVCIFMLVVIELVMMVGVKLNPMSEDFAERLSNAKARTDVSYPEIDGLRAIASIHIMVFNLNKYLMAGGTSYSCNFCGYGKYWLQAMFTISGFLSAAGWYLQPERRAVVLTHPCRWTVTYVIQSVVRWMPLYLASIGLSLLGRAMSSKEFSLEGGDLTMSIFMVQSWFSPYHWDFNDPTFFMSNLFLFTILFPHWMNATIRFSGSLNGIILFLAWLASFGPTMACYVFFDMALYKKMYGNSVHDFIEFHPFSNWPAYLCGVLLAQILSPWLYQKVTTTAATHRLLGGATTATLVAVFLFFYFGTSPGDYMGKYSLLFEKGPFAIPVVLILLTAGSLNATTDLQKPAKHNHPAGPMGRPSSNNLRDDEHDNQPAPKAEELEKLNKPRSLLVRGMVGFLHFFNSIGGKFLVWLQPLHVIAWPLFILHAGIDEFLKPITQWITSGRMSLRAIFELADRDSSGSLNMSEYTVLAHNLNATMGTALVADAFSVADADGDGMLAPSECVLCLWADANKDFVVSSDELNDAVGTVSPYAALWLGPILQLLCAWLAYRLIERPWGKFCKSRMFADLLPTGPEADHTRRKRRRCSVRCSPRHETLHETPNFAGFGTTSVSRNSGRGVMDEREVPDRDSWDSDDRRGSIDSTATEGSVLDSPSSRPRPGMQAYTPPSRPLPRDQGSPGASGFGTTSVPDAMTPSPRVDAPGGNFAGYMSSSPGIATPGGASGLNVSGYSASTRNSPASTVGVSPASTIPIDSPSVMAAAVEEEEEANLADITLSEAAALPHREPSSRQSNIPSPEPTEAITPVERKKKKKKKTTPKKKTPRPLPLIASPPPSDAASAASSQRSFALSAPKVGRTMSAVQDDADETSDIHEV